MENTTTTRKANRLISGAYGATSFDQLQPGTRVNDEFGRYYGMVQDRYVSPNPEFHGVDADELLVIVTLADGSEMSISGRWLEPIVEPAPKQQSFRELAIGQTFDFIDDSRRGMNSFFARCTKRSARTYSWEYLGGYPEPTTTNVRGDIVTSVAALNVPQRITAYIGSIRAEVFHVRDAQPQPQPLPLLWRPCVNCGHSGPHAPGIGCSVCECPTSKAKP